MPDITEISVTYHNEVRGREEYSPPMRKAEVRITATVPAGENPDTALDQVANRARAKVAELLGAPPAVVNQLNPPNAASPAEQGSDTSGSATAASTGSPGPQAPSPPQSLPPSEGGTRKRPTKAEKEAAAAAQAAALAEAEGGQPQEQRDPPGEHSPGSSEGSPAADPWEVKGDDEVAAITDDELTQACAANSQRVGDSAKIKEVIASYKPTSNWPEGKPFSVRDILASQRPGFLKKLEELK